VLRRGDVTEKSFGIGVVDLALRGWVCCSVGASFVGSVVCLFFVRVNQVLVRLWALPFAFV